jgi:hypothetical protein
VATLCWSGLGAAPVLAADFASGAGLLLTHESNMTRTPVPVADWTRSLIAGFLYQERTIDLIARVSAEVEWRDYLKNSFADENLFFVNANAVWTILPKQFNWTFEDVARQVRVDVTSADTPSNRANSNTLNTGPDFTLLLNPGNSAVIGARYGRFDIAEATGDNVHYTVYGRFLHQLSEPTTVSLNYRLDRGYFKQPALYSQVTQQDGFIRYDTRFTTLSSMTIDFGLTRIAQDGTEDLPGRLFRLTARRQITAGSSLALLLAQEYSSTSTDLLRGVTSVTAQSAETPPATAVITTDTYYSTRGDLTYANQDGFLGTSLNGYARRVDYRQLPQDYDEFGGRLTLTWLFSGETRIRANTEYVQRIFKNSISESGGGASPVTPTNQTDKESITSLGVDYKLSRNVTGAVEGSRLSRASTEPSSNFVDWRLMLFLGYSTGPLYMLHARR